MTTAELRTRIEQDLTTGQESNPFISIVRRIRLNDEHVAWVFTDSVGELSYTSTVQCGLTATIDDDATVAFWVGEDLKEIRQSDDVAGTTQPTEPKRCIASVDALGSRVEIDGDQNAYVCLSLERARLVPMFNEMRADGQDVHIVERTVRALGLSFPVFVLIDR